MAIDMVFFDFRDEEKDFFNKNCFPNFNFTFYKESLNLESVKNLSEEVKCNTTVISVFTDSDVCEGVIGEFKNLRIISTRSVSYDHISKKAAIERNIAVLNVPNYGEKSVAQYTLGLILALVRNLISATSGNFSDKTELSGRDLSELSLGIVGTGAVGAAVCKIAQFFKMKIYGYDIKPKQELVKKYGLEYLPLNDFIRNSDIITLHLPYTGDNFKMFSKSEFDLMKDGAYFINTSSSRLVDTKALYNAVKSGKIKGVALDFTVCKFESPECYMPQNPSEICREENKFLNLLKSEKNVIITPHIAYDTKESVNYILQSTMDNIKNTIQCGNVYGVY